MKEVRRAWSAISAFVSDYCRRHAHPVNALMHLIGVPVAFTGLYLLFQARWADGLVLVVGGYLLQYLGHRAQGNEVGEVTLLKAIWRRLAARGGAQRG